MDDQHLDLALLTELMRDGRISGSELTRRIDAPATRVRSRLAALLDSEHMQVTAFVDPTLVGRPVVAMLEISSLEPTVVMQALTHVEVVAWNALCRSGRVFAQISVGSTRELAVVLDRVRSVPGVRRVGTNLLLRGLSRSIGADATTRPFAFVGGEALALDETDTLIIHDLQVDGRMPFRMLADRTGLSIPAVRQRYGRLVRTGALSVIARPLPALLGRTSAAHISATVVGDMNGLVDAMARIPDVTFVAECAGDTDLLIEVACINDETMHERIEQIRKLLGDGEVRVEPHVDVRAVRANF